MTLEELRDKLDDLGFVSTDTGIDTPYVYCLNVQNCIEFLLDADDYYRFILFWDGHFAHWKNDSWNYIDDVLSIEDMMVLYK